MSALRNWLITAAALLGIALTVSLGFWQWGRGHQRDALQAAIEARKTATALDGTALVATKNIADAVYRPVLLRGRWDAAHTVFLDNRQMDAKVGFYVVTPLLLDDSNRAVLVQRGWAPRNFEKREQLPPVETPAGPVEVRGRLAPPPAKLYELGAAGQGPIRQNLDIDAFAAETRLALLPLSVQQLGAPSEGLQRDWPTVASGAAKNYGYAFQWWAMSGLIAILYVWFRFIAPARRARRL